MSMPCTPATRAWQVFLIFLRLGLTSFGGPVAHLGYFRTEFVQRRGWLGERSYADLVALCQFLPGPASSQVGIAIGMSRAGQAGALAAWLGFTLPSALALLALAQGLALWGDALPAGLLQGLKVVAVAVVAQAVWGMGRSLCPDAPRLSLMGLACCAALFWPSAAGQIIILLGAAAIGLRLPRSAQPGAHEPLPIRVSRRTALLSLALFFALLLGLPLLAAIHDSPTLHLLDIFYRAGSLVFGGGHVVLALLQAEVVPSGLVEADAFLAGYGAAQAVPGPLFTFAAFLGAALEDGAGGWRGALLCLVAIFLPSFLLVNAALPFWEGLRRHARMQAALSGLNAAVVGLLLAALYQPVWTGSILGAQDFALCLLAFLALSVWKLPVWWVVALGALSGWLLG